MFHRAQGEIAVEQALAEMEDQAVLLGETLGPRRLVTPHECRILRHSALGREVIDHFERQPLHTNLMDRR